MNINNHKLKEVSNISYYLNKERRLKKELENLKQ